MPWQLIYTSSPRGLAAGQSGFGTVARSAELREALVTRLEQLSSYHHLAPVGAGSTAANPVISAYRIVDIRGAKYHVLTRIQDAGLDFTNRTNHLAHHLVFQPYELAAMPSPAAILLCWKGWRAEWKEEPRFLADAESGSLAQVPMIVPLPAKAWQQVTGDAGSAAALLEGQYAAGCYLLCQRGGEEQWLQLIAESLQLLNPEGRSPLKAWQYTFTSVLQGEDNPADFRWRGCRAGTPGYEAVLRSGATVLDPASLRAPENELAHLARHGKFSRAAVAEGPSALSNQRDIVAGPGLATSKTTLLSKKDVMPKAPVAVAGLAPAAELESSTSAAEEPASLFARLARPPFAWVCLASTILLLLAAGLLWPGWLRAWFREADEQTDAGGKPSAAMTQRPPPAPSPSAGPRPPPQGSTATATVAQTPPDASALLEQLEAKLDTVLPDIPTSLILAGGQAADAFDLTRIAGLDKLVQKLLEPNDPISGEAVECYVQTGQLGLSLAEPPGKMALSADLFGKTLSAPEKTGLQLKFDFSRGSGQPILLVTDALRSSAFLSIILRPVAAKQGAFPAFRLAFVSFTGGRSAVEPIQLDPSFLRLSPTNRSISLQPALRRRLEKIKPAATPFQFQLRPFVANGEAKTNRDLFAHWPAKYRPAASLDLNFADQHRHLTNELQRLEAGRAKLENSSQALRDARDQIHIPAHDLPLGRLVGLRPNDPLHSFGSYCQQPALASPKNSSQTNQLFLGYLRKLLEKGKAVKAFDPETVAQQLDNPKTLANALLDIQSLLIPDKSPRASLEIPPDYFLSKWQKLKYEDDLLANETIKAEVDREVQRLAAVLQELPEDLASLSRLSLFVVSSGRQFELIHFTGLDKATAP